MRRSFEPYHTLEELIGRKVVVADLTNKLSKIPRSDVLRCIAGFSALLERNVNAGYSQELQLLNQITEPKLANSIEASLKEAKNSFGALFHRRQLW